MSSNFQDLVAESSVIGTIATGLFDKIPEDKLISPKEFTDERWRLIYGGAHSLRKAGVPVCPERISDMIATRGLDGELQKAIDPSNTISWRNWPDFADGSLAFSLTTAPVEYALQKVGELYEKRETAAIAKRMEAGQMSSGDAIEALQELKKETHAIPQPKPLVAFADKPPDHAKTILGNRFLCADGGMLFVGPSGIGKTSASIQQDLLWSVGESAFGIAPARPLKIITLQAEDDDGDLSEIVSGVKAGLQLTPDQCLQSSENCFYATVKSPTGIEFLEGVVRPILKKHRPDLLRINPFHAYLGGDVKDTALTANFLRNHLNPLLAEFQCACIIVHHTPKVTFRDTKEWKSSDWMYAGAGAADITNWCRAALIIDPTTNPRVFRFIAAKRASRIGWEDDITGEREYIRHFAHDDNGSIYWRDALEDEIQAAQKRGEDERTQERILSLIPPCPLELFRPEIVSLAKSKYNIGENATKRTVAILIENKTIEVIKKPRPRTKDAEYLRRAE